MSDIFKLRIWDIARSDISSLDPQSIHWVQALQNLPTMLCFMLRSLAGLTNVRKVENTIFWHGLGHCIFKQIIPTLLHTRAVNTYIILSLAEQHFQNINITYLSIKIRFFDKLKWKVNKNACNFSFLKQAVSPRKRSKPL